MLYHIGRSSVLTRESSYMPGWSGDGPAGPIHTDLVMVIGPMIAIPILSSVFLFLLFFLSTPTATDAVFDLIQSTTRLFSDLDQFFQVDLLEQNLLDTTCLVFLRR